MFHNAGLTENETQCLAMWCYDGKTQVEIASMTGRTQQAVQKSISKGQAKLAKLGIMARKLRIAKTPYIAAVPNHEIESLNIAAVF